MTDAESIPANRPQVERRRSAARRLGRPLKIALLGYRSNPYVGGQGIYINYLSAALAAMGHTVHVFSGPPYPELADGVPLIKVPGLNLYAADNHVTALRLGHLRSLSDLAEWWIMLTGGFAEPYTFGRRIRKILANTDYDIVHDNQSLSYGLLELQKDFPVVSTIHHPIHRDREQAIQVAADWQHRLLARRWYHFVRMQEKVVDQLEHITTVSEASLRDIRDYFGRDKNIRLILNGIDADVFRPIRTQKVPFRIITTASSDQPIKGLRHLLEAVALTQQRYPETHLRIIGQLKKGGSNDKLIDQLNLRQHVSFRSGISTEELVLEYNQASIAVCPSLYEGFGLPAGEAMACGLPLVSTDGGALPEVVADSGLVVQAGDAPALAAGIQLLFENRELAKSLGDSARQRIIEKFTWRRVAEDLTRYYHEIIAARAKK